MELSTLRRPSALLPIGMSLAALGLVVGHTILFGSGHEPDEGAAAHLWQVLMAGQLPIVTFFVVRHVPDRPGPGLAVLGLQGSAWLAAAAPVFLLRL
jgi:hypothetical protein